jgi:hypothetical protein
MGRPKSENSVEPNYDDIQYYLTKAQYPEHLQGDCGKKANFRRVCCQYAVIDGVLHYRHKKHRNDKTGYTL